MTITIGWWAIPLGITVAGLIWGLLPERPSYYGFDVVGAFKLLGTVIISLIAWLIWALVA